MENELRIIEPSQIQLLKDTICKDLTDDEFNLFLYVSKRTGLDALARQIYAVKRWNAKLGRNEMTIQTSIDGFRVVAERSNKYAGQLGPFWCGDDGVWCDVWLKKEMPIAAKVAVLKSDFKEPLWAVAKFDSYAQRTKEGKLAQFWQKMGEHMIAKVAEALALRKAFPQDLSGIYTSDELANDEISIIKDVSPKELKKEEPKKEESKKAIKNYADNPPASLGQFQKIKEFREILNITTDQLKASINYFFHLEDPKKMTFDQANLILRCLEKSKNKDEYDLCIESEMMLLKLENNK